MGSGMAVQAWELGGEQGQRCQGVEAGASGLRAQGGSWEKQE